MRRLLASAVAKRRRKVLLGGDEAGPSFASSTFTAASATGTADGSTTNTLTLTLYDTNGVLMPSQAVTFTTELTAVSAGQSTLVDDAAEIATTTGTLNLILTVRNAAGVPLPNIQSARIVFASTGTGNTFGTPSVTDRHGQSLCTFSSTVAEAKTISVTVDGVAVTQTAAVTVTGGAPSLPTLDFFADWRTATGTGASAVGDGGKFNQIGGSGCEVITNPGTINFPASMTNVLAVKLNQSNGGYTEPRKTSGLTAPAVGEARYYRVYFRLTSAAGDAVTDLEQHPIQDGSSASQINWGWWIYHSTGGAGKWTLQWRPSASANAYPNDRWQLGTALDHDTTYRLEWYIDRTGTTTFKAGLRVYTATGTLLYTGANFSNQSGATDLDTYMASNDFTFFNIANIVAINTGSNGLGGTDWTDGMTYSYQGGLATGIDTGWIGAHDGTNG